MQEEEQKQTPFYKQLRETGADAIAIYTQLADNYDSIMENHGYGDPLLLTQFLEAHFPD